MRRGDGWLLALMAAAAGLWLYYFSGWFSGSGGGSGEMNDSTLDKLARAIYDFEDPKKNSVATRNNNPGNLKAPNGKPNFWQGQTGVDERGFAIFDSMDNGFRALKMQFTIEAGRHPNWTLLQFITDFLGGNPAAPAVSKEGNPFTYAAAVASKVGASVGSTLSNLLRG